VVVGAVVVPPLLVGVTLSNEVGAGEEIVCVSNDDAFGGLNILRSPAPVPTLEAGGESPLCWLSLFSISVLLSPVSPIFVFLLKS
jgi:hypothetical protein